MSYRGEADRLLRVAHCSNVECSAATLTTLANAGEIGVKSELAIAPDGQPTVSFLSIGGTTTMHVFHWSGTAWQEYGTGLPVTYFWAPNALAVAPDGLPVVAHVDVSGDLRVARWNGAAWANAGGPIEAVAGTTTAAPALVVDADDAPIVAWHEVDPAPIGGRENVYVARFDAVGGSWSRLGDSLDAYLPHRAWYPDLALAADGVSPVVGWTEYDGLHSDGYAARWTGTHWRHAGGELGGDGIVNVVAVAVDPLSDRTIASWNDYGVPEYGDADVHVARFNADFETLSGLPGALENANCLDAFPTGAPPATLAGIGCFVGSPTPNAAAAGLVPYDLNSPLWSDDALKRRWLLLPPAGEIGWEAASAWTFPDGTLFFKEFALERVKGDPGTRFPIETRVLVIRDAATVEGYSYKWRDDGSNADLLPDAPLLDSYEYFDAGVLVVDTHTFPSRAQCNACHSAIAGFILGPTTPNMNRPFDYGHTVENQLRAFQSAGLFGASLPAGQDDPGTLESQPRTLEMAQPLEARAKSYFAANCAHCHRVGGVTSALFEWERTLPNMAICDDIVPADPVNSFLYQRIVAVPGGAPSPMPPLARREVDPIAESVVFDWISAMSACP